MNLRRIVRVCCVIALPSMTVASELPAQGPSSPAPVLKLRVAVMDLNGVALRMQTTGGMAPTPAGGFGQQSQTTISIPPPAEFARSLTEALTTLLVNTNRFMVLERAALAQVQQEQDLGASGRVNKETSTEIGKIVGAQMLITGDISGFSYQHSSIGGKMTNVLKGVNASIERVVASVSIDLRLIDAVTGEVVASVKGDGQAAQNGVATDLTKDEKKMDGSVSLSTPLGQASRDAIQKSVAGILANLPKVRWSARVIDFRDGVVYVNAGSVHGMVVGTALELFEPQSALIDPVSGRNLGSPDKLLGEVVVDRVDAEYATARVVSGTGFARNQVVRLKGQGARP